MRRLLLTDPRYYQMVTLSAVMLFGLARCDLQLQGLVCGAILCSVLVSERLAANLVSQRQFEWRSALITGLSLCLLLRTSVPWLAASTGALAIASKYLLRGPRGHLFNPSALALVAATSIFDQAWISPGQWGHSYNLCLLACGCGLIVVSRAARLDVSLALLLSYAALVAARAYYLDDPLALVGHQLSNGSLLIFAFFMISDPRTTPATRAGRISFAMVVAILAYWWEFVRYEPNGLIFALVWCAPLIPALDRLFPARDTARPCRDPAATSAAVTPLARF